MTTMTILRAALIFLIPVIATGQPLPGDDLLAHEDAFPLRAWRVDAVHIAVEIGVAPGYALYRSRLLAASPVTQVQSVDAPPGEWVEDPFLGPQRIYTSTTRIDVQVPAPVTGSPGEMLEITTQGCALDLACFEPLTRAVRVDQPRG